MIFFASVDFNVTALEAPPADIKGSPEKKNDTDLTAFDLPRYDSDSDKKDNIRQSKFSSNSLNVVSYLKSITSLSGREF